MPGLGSRLSTYWPFNTHDAAAAADFDDNDNDDDDDGATSSIVNMNSADRGVGAM